MGLEVLSLAVEEAPRDNYPPSFSRLSSSADSKAPGRSEKTKRQSARRMEQFEKELDAEGDITLSEDGSDKKDRSSRNGSLSLSQFLESFTNPERRQPGTLESRRPRQHEATHGKTLCSLYSCAGSRSEREGSFP
jgi:hypothetical protein